MESINLREKMVYSDKSLTKKIVYRDKDVLAFVLNFKPGQTLPLHNHPGMVTIIQVLQGTAKFTLGDSSRHIGAGQIIVYQQDEKVGLINEGNENLSLYVTLTPGPADERYAAEV